MWSSGREGEERASVAKEIKSERERHGELQSGLVWVDEGDSEYFYGKSVPGMCQWLQRQQLPVNETSLGTAVTGRQVRELLCRVKKGILFALYVGCT